MRKNITVTETVTFHSILITRENGSHVYGCSLQFYEPVSKPEVVDCFECLQEKFFAGRQLVDTDELSYFNRQCDNLYIAKCICLLTTLPIISPCHTYLKQLFDITVGGKRADLPLESYLYNLVFELPLPPSGMGMQFYGPLSPISIQLPGKMDLPLCDYSFKVFFQSLRLRTLLKLFACVLLEKRVLLISSGKLL